jgi:hypothetical protein
LTKKPVVKISRHCSFKVSIDFAHLISSYGTTKKQLKMDEFTRRKDDRDHAVVRRRLRLSAQPGGVDAEEAEEAAAKITRTEGLFFSVLVTFYLIHSVFCGGPL